MDLRNESPRTRIFHRDGSHTHLRLEDYESFRAAWQAGKAFWDGVDPFGASVSVKLAEITIIFRITADVCAELKAEDEEEERRKMLKGGE